jgi:acetylornithine deacetylase/succinyl-diaminopimelate desuccinylase-like protein
VRVVDSVAAVRQRITRLLADVPLPVTWSEETSNDPQHLIAVPGEPTTVVAFNTDVPHLGRFGERLLMGPGSILDAHGAQERIRIADLGAAVAAYKRAVLHLRQPSARPSGPTKNGGGA